jgi:choline-sulfatase
MKKPNILLVFPDQLGAGWLPVYGNPIVRAPVLNSFARQSVVFEQAITSAPVCTPYRGCLLTGLYPSQTGVTDNGMALPPDATTLAHHLSNAGYETRYIGKWHLSGDPQGNRWVPPHQRGGFQHFTGWESHHVDHSAGLIWADNPDVAISLGAHETDGLAEIVIEQLAAVQPPFCMVVSFQAPHPPCSPPDEFRAPYQNIDLMPEPNADRAAWYNQPEWNANYGVQEFRERYFGEITQIDAAFGRILQALDANGLADDTVVIFTSDHGEMAGAQGLFGKGVMYQEALHVPLMVRMPRQRVARRVAAPVSTVDFLPTLLDLAGCDPVHGAPGASFRPILEGAAGDARRAVFSEYRNRCVVKDDWKLFTEGIPAQHRRRAAPLPDVAERQRSGLDQRRPAHGYDQ